MEKEREILNTHVAGTQTGEDNKLRAAIGLLSANKANELIFSLDGLKKVIQSSVSNLMINNMSNSNSLIKGMGDEVSNLNQGIRLQVENMIRSNDRLGKSNEVYARWMKWLTVGLFFVGIAQVVVTWIKSN